VRRLLLIALLAGCGEPAPDTDAPVHTGDDTDVDTDTDSDTATQAEPASVALHVGSTVLQTGASTRVQVDVLDAQGQPVDVAFGLAIEDDTVLQVTDEQDLLGVAPGQTTVRAVVGDLSSPAVSVRVAEPPTAVDPELGWTAGALVAQAGDTLDALPLLVRDGRGLRTTPSLVHLHSDDEDVVRIEGEHAVAAGPGTAWLTATWRDADSPPLPITVVEAGGALHLDRLTPDGTLTADTRAVLAWTTAVVPPSGGPGEPVLADRVDVVDHASGEVLAQAEVQFGEARITLDTSAWEAGTYALRARATRGGATAHEAPVRLVVSHPDRAVLSDALLGSFADESGWSNNRLDPERYALSTHGDTPWLSSVLGGRVRPGAWRGDRWRGPSDADFTRSHDGHATLRRYAGTWHPNATLRDLPQVAIDPSGRPVVAYTFDDDAHRSEPRYWRSVSVARWQDDGHHDSLDGGWVLLTTETARRHEIHELPTVQMPFPAGPLATREHLASTPRITFDADTGEPVVAYVRTPASGDAWSLEVRRWTGSAWTDATPAVPLDLTLARLVQLQTDASGDLHATVHGVASGQPVTVRVALHAEPTSVRLPGHAWFSVEHGLAIQDQGGDLVVSAWDGTTATPVSVLDRHPFATATSPCLAERDDQLVVAWHEGPADAARVRAARWSVASQDFVPLDVPGSLDPAALTRAPRCAVDASGRTLIAWTEPGFYGRFEFEDDRLYVARFPPFTD